MLPDLEMITYLVFSSARVSEVLKWFPVDADTLIYIENLHLKKKKKSQVNLIYYVIFLVLDPLNCRIMSKLLLYVDFFEYQKHHLRT